MFIDCHKETVAALKYEGNAALGSGFQLLGQTAARGLMGDPAVAGQMAAIEKAMDPSKLESLAKEAGVLPAAGTPVK
jgi:hypothetical protein